MLRVRLEIVPFGDESQVQEIGRLDVFNKGYVDVGVCDYGVLSLDPGDVGEFIGTVKHRRSEGAWSLVRKVIAEAIESTAAQTGP